jgi:MA3 domain.
MNKGKLLLGLIKSIESLGIKNYFMKEIVKMGFSKIIEQIPDDEIEKYKEIEKLAKKYARLINNEIKRMEKNFSENSPLLYFIFITLFLSNISKEKYNKYIYIKKNLYYNYE